MAESTPNPLPHYLSGKQFTSRLGETERQLAADYIAQRFPDGKLPATTREFLIALLSAGAGLPGKQAGANTEEVNALKTELETAKGDLERLQAIMKEHNFSGLKTEMELLKAENEKLKAGITFDIFEDERLKGFRSFRKADHQHPFDTLQYHHDEAIKSIREYEFAKAELEGQPLKVLDGEEYQAFKKWDEEVLTPALHALTGIPEQFDEKTGKRINVFLPRHKFIMMWDYCQADPIQGVLQLFPNATEQQKALFEDMQFPRASVVAQVLKDIEEIRQLTENPAANDPAPPVQTPTEGGKVVPLNPTAGAEITEPAADSENGNKPEE